MPTKKKEKANNMLSEKNPEPAPVPVAPVENPKTEAVAAGSKKATFRVFNDRWALVAQVHDEAEARELAVKFNGTYKAI